MQNIEVHSECSSSSNADVIVEAIFDNENSFKEFKSNEAYNTVTKEVVVPFLRKMGHYIKPSIYAYNLSYMHR